MNDSATVNTSHIGTYPPKQVIGDWTRTSHEVLSSFVQSDTTGGEIRGAVECTDLGRLWRVTSRSATKGGEWPLSVLHQEQ